VPEAGTIASKENQQQVAAGECWPRLKIQQLTDVRHVGRVGHNLDSQTNTEAGACAAAMPITATINIFTNLNKNNKDLRPVQQELHDAEQ
jgi:hypothetical protein